MSGALLRFSRGGKDDGPSESIILNDNLLPVLIIPGFMSSSLMVSKSGISKRYNGSQVWMNPISLGFGGLYLGRALENKDNHQQLDKDQLESHSEKVHIKQDDDDDNEVEENFHDDSEEDSDSEDDEKLNLRKKEKGNQKAPFQMTKEKYEENVRCKNSWLHHITLQNDSVSERRGNEIRPVEGLNGCDYLFKVMDIDVRATFVFARVIKALLNVGYVRELNLDAATYDWRLSPRTLEERDRYFSRTLERIEKMYKDNKETSIVLMCHSLGCKVGHYLLNYAKAVRGQAWLDKHIHTFLPVNGVHAGAPVGLGYALTGISMDPILDPILSIEERIIFARSLGVGPWIIPRQLPSDMLSFPNIIYRRQGCLEIKINPMRNLEQLLETKFGVVALDDIFLAISFGSSPILKSRWSIPYKTSEGLYATITESFFFSTPPNLDDGNNLGKVKFFLYTKGTQSAKSKEQAFEKKMSGIEEGFFSKVAHGVSHVKHGVSHVKHNVVEHVMDVVSQHKNSHLFAYTQEETFPTEKLISSDTHEMDYVVTFLAKADTRSLKGRLFRRAEKNSRSMEATMSVRWIPPLEDKRGEAPILSKLPSRASAEIPLLKSSKQKNSDYVPLSGQTVLRALKCPSADNIFKVIEEHYEHDPLGPRTMSSEEAPPVSRVFAVYGINVPTDVGYVVCRPPGVVQKEGREKPKFILDTSAYIPFSEENFGYVVNGGKVQETRDTLQKRDVGGVVCNCSGDGTVPYWSLSVPKKWNSPTCQVRITELNGKGSYHRDMLGDPRCHKVLLNYLGGKSFIMKYETKAIEIIQKYVRRWKLKKEGKLSSFVDVVDIVVRAEAS